MSSAAAAGVADADARPVAMQDLEAHHRPLRAELDAAALRVLHSGRYVLGADGSEVRAFEEEAAAALGVAHAVGVSSGTDALLALLMAAGVGPGDDVVTTPFSFIAPAGVIARLGARPVFADIEPFTWTLDPAAAVACLGPATKAVLPVHLFGRVARTPSLEAACVARGVPLFEDAAQAIAATDGGGRAAGTIGQAAALSFFPSKNLGGFGDGGMVLTNDAALARRVRLLRVHGASAKFHHPTLGGNFRLDELQAGLLRVKLPHLPRWTAARRRVAGWYRQALADVPVVLPPDDAGCVWNQFVLGVPGDRRDGLAAHLAARGIATAVYYPEPLHLQPCFAHLGHRRGDFPVAERACREALAIPLHPDLTEPDVARVAATIHGYFSPSRVT
ncbi:MAG: DegT/DnrJ/EryC1/StrS family aminotransferase [Pseudomonadota bacterium]